ncbi:MAG: hypothetical protein ABSA54_02450 [Terriglobales bacterium]
MVDQKLGHYRIVEKIGAGGMGEVFAPATSTSPVMLPSKSFRPVRSSTNQPASSSTEKL